MRNRKFGLLSATFAALIFGAAATWACPTCHKMLEADDLQWKDVPFLPPGAKMAAMEPPTAGATPFTFRLKLSPGFKVHAHWHSAIEHVTVISGTFHMGIGDKLDTTKTRALGPGSFAVMQPKTTHYGWVKEETIVQIHGVGPWGITYVDPANDPTKNTTKK